MGSLIFKKGTTAFPTSGLTTDALYFSIDKSTETLEMGLALDDNTLALLNATTADKLNTSAGAELVPVYFKDGVPVACPVSGSKNRWGIIPTVDASGDMYVGDKILFYTTDAGTAGPTITATVNGLTLSGTTSGTFSGSLTGNADTATKWKTVRTLSWTGDATGSMSIDGSENKSTALTLSSTGVTAGTYGAAANKTLAHGESFNVPTFTVDAKGRLSKAATYTLTLPSVSTLTVKQNQGTEAEGSESLITTYDTTSAKTITINAAKSRQGVFYIEGTYETDDDGYVTWLGFHDDITELFSGLAILYKVPKTGSSYTYFSLNDEGKVKVVRNSSSNVTSHFPAGSIVLLIYTVDSDGTAYWKVADYDSNTKNTAGTTNKSATKLFLAGATTQSANPTTYSNSSVYVGTDNHLYSNGVQVVNLSGSQALTNKTYNGYTLAAACAKGVTDSTSASAIGTGTSLPTERDIYYGLPTINGVHDYTSSTTIFAPISSGSDGQLLVANSSAAPTWLAPSSITVGAASKLATARTISLTGDVSGSGSFDGSGNLSISVTVADNSHNHNYLPLAGGTLTGDLILSSSTTAHANYPSISWGSINSVEPFIGYADDQSDGTFLLMSLAGSSSYQNGLAIGGSSGNLLWKGKKVLTTEDMYFSGGSGSADDASVVGGVLADTHTITVSKKTITAGTNIAITGGTSVIKVALTGTVAVGNGGTGTNTAPTQGGVIYASSTSKYASTAAGTSGYILKSNGTGAPTWMSQGNINAGTADALKLSAAVGSTNTPVYFGTSGVPQACSFSFSNSAIDLTAADGSATAPTVQAVRNAINASFAAQDAMIFKGVVDAESDLPTNNYQAGWTYKISASGEFAGQQADAGDMIIAIVDGPTSGTTVTDANWMVIQSNVDGPVFMGTSLGVGSTISPVYVDKTGQVKQCVGPVGSTTLPIFMNSSGELKECSATLGVSITGNAATATKLATARTINGTSFNGTSNITTANWGTARNISIASHDGKNAGTAVSVDGSADITLLLPNTITATLKGSVEGNASTASAFSSAATVKLTGDVTGEASSTKGWTVTTALASSGVTAGTYGPTGTDTSPGLSHSGTFIVPQVIVDVKGRITSAKNYTFSLPSDSDQKVKQSASTADNNIPLLLAYQASPESGTISTVNYGTGITANPKTSTITATTFSGNASTATQFSSNASVTLTGDVTGTASSKKGWSITTTLANSGVTAGSYGLSAASKPSHGGSFNVPYITVDAKGRITAAATNIVTLPADNDYRVQQTLSSANSNLPLLLAYQASPSSGTAQISYYDTGIYANPSTNTITATTFAGALSGNASTATKLNGTNAGGELIPTYFKSGVPTVCTMTGSSNYWGALPWINASGVMDVGSTINFHASDAGTTGAQIIYNSTDNCIDFIFA